MKRPHALMLPFPAQGHIIPLLELAYALADHGFKITFVTTDFDHPRLLAAMSTTNTTCGGIRLVSIRDGLPEGADRNDIGGLCETMPKYMPGHLEELINNSEEEFTCVVADQSVAWVFDVAKRMNLRSVAFWPQSACMLLVTLTIPRLIQDGIIDKYGTMKTPGMFYLSREIPGVDPIHLIWNCFLDAKTRQIAFNYLVANSRAVEAAEFVLCNSFYELERPVFGYAPTILPVGPVLAGRRADKAAGSYWAEDATCIGWLDEQPANSVIYVAFGSLAMFDQKQFQEMAQGLEISGRKFLWVVRPDFTEKASEDTFLEGFKGRVEGQGKMVDWAPQQEVLAHPAIACFVSHCGWNSTMEGLINGVPFLCCPYFADQHFNQRYICDIWQTGLKLIPDEHNVVTKEQIKEKVEELLGDEGIRGRALAFKEMAGKSTMEGGSSFENFHEFVNAMKEEKKL